MNHRIPSSQPPHETFLPLPFCKGGGWGSRNALPKVLSLESGGAEVLPLGLSAVHRGQCGSSERNPVLVTLCVCTALGTRIKAEGHGAQPWQCGRTMPLGFTGWGVGVGRLSQSRPLLKAHTCPVGSGCWLLLKPVLWPSLFCYLEPANSFCLRSSHMFFLLPSPGLPCASFRPQLQR